MALRNYLYYKHEDEMKDKIAHMPETPGTPPFAAPVKRKRITPTQLRKLEMQTLAMNIDVQQVGQGQSACSRPDKN